MKQIIKTIKLLQLNTTVNSGSTGRIAEDIGQVMLAHGHQSHIAFGRGERPSRSALVRIGSQKDVLVHGAKTLLFDRHGFGSSNATKKLLNNIEEINPDIIGLHNIHGYYLHIGLLFEFLSRFNKPVVWTLHDCWPFTGHCTHYEDIGCAKWQTGCYACPKTSKYPRSLGMDASRSNFADKKRLFNLPANMTIVTPCKWMQAQVGQSFLRQYPSKVIYNGIDTNTFKQASPPVEEDGKKIVLGVASVWQASKGLDDFFQLAKLLPEQAYKIVLIGLNKQQLDTLPANITGILRTESVEELAGWYAKAAVFVNPTYLDNFPTTNIEALACGTPVVAYRTGGCPEAVDEHTGLIVEKGDIRGMAAAIAALCQEDRAMLRQQCRQRAVQYFDKTSRYLEYLALYESLVSVPA